MIISVFLLLGYCEEGAFETFIVVYPIKEVA